MHSAYECLTRVILSSCLPGSCGLNFPKIIIANSFQRTCVSDKGLVRICADNNELSCDRSSLIATPALGDTRNLIFLSIYTTFAESW